MEKENCKGNGSSNVNSVPTSYCGRNNSTTLSSTSSSSTLSSIVDSTKEHNQQCDTTKLHNNNGSLSSSLSSTYHSTIQQQEMPILHAQQQEPTDNSTIINEDVGNKLESMHLTDDYDNKDGVTNTAIMITTNNDRGQYKNGCTSSSSNSCSSNSNNYTKKKNDNLTKNTKKSSSNNSSSAVVYIPSGVPKHIRLLPKTQSLDLCDERTDPIILLDGLIPASPVTVSTSIGSNIESDSSSTSNNSSSNNDTDSQSLKMMPKLQSFDQNRPIYPNVPYSPYGSPYNSPRSGRRRPPLRESRRVSIEQTGSFLQLNQYKLMDQIGQGSYGLVKLAYSEEDSTHYAMKILSKRKLLRKAGLIGRGPKKGISPLDRVYREIAVLKKLDHPNVVKLVEVLDDPLEDSLYLVFELVTQGEVLTIPNDNPLKEERAWSVFRDALQGLEYLHYQRIIHSDIKPGNLLLGECGCVKIADLGVCNEFMGDDASMNNGSTAGTPAFRAPETLQTGQHSYSGKAADIWALGATLYALLFGNVPFLATNVPAVYEKIKNEQLKIPVAPTISIELKDLLEQMLNKDPTQRITLPQIKEHTWVTNKGTNPLKSEEENCRLVQISDEDINSVVTSIPKLDTLILIKTMLKKHSFLNPFAAKGVSGRAPMRGGSRLERFTRAGRSNSAPGAYHMIERQLSSDNILPSLTEGVVSSHSSFGDEATNDGGC